MEYYFDPDDKLERRKYAEFLKSMLENCDKYRREDSDGAYVIAIDSPWGTGKTRFAKMLRNYLENHSKDTPIEAPIDPSNGILTVYYNAWDTDFSTDALEPLIYSIINSPEFESELFDRQADEELNNFKDTAKKVLKVIGLSAAHHFFGETTTSAIEKCLEIDDKTKPDNYGFEKRRQVILEFRETLSRVIAKTQMEKLVIIIDELDRCRPTYAIQTLEIIKHLFSVKGLVFIFALDIKQLSSSVKTVYGNEMDAAGYLCRFFDYIGRIPAPDIRRIISLQLSKIDYYNRKIEQSHFKDNNVEYIKRLSETFGFSLRDIDTIIKSYSAMCKCFLEKYDDYIKHQVYLFLLSLKYKDIDAFNKVFKIVPILPRTESTISDKYVLEKYADYAAILTSLNNDAILRNAFFPLKYRKESNKEVDNAKIISIDTSTLSSFGFLIIRFLSEPGKVAFQILSNECNDFSWGRVIFYEDLVNWETIKELTLSEYIYSQLEMFNFALPADKGEPKS